MQHLPGIEQRFRQYFMLYPFALEHFDLSEFDLIFSSSSGYAKGVRRRSKCDSRLLLPHANALGLAL